MQSVVIYPNPNIGVFDVKSEELIKEFAIYKLNGSLEMKFAHVNSDELHINMEDYPTGLYVLEYSDMKGNKVAEKFIIE